MSDFILLETLMHIEAMANVMDSLLLFVRVMKHHLITFPLHLFAPLHLKCTQ